MTSAKRAPQARLRFQPAVMFPTIRSMSIPRLHTKRRASTALGGPASSSGGLPVPKQLALSKVSSVRSEGGCDARAAESSRLVGVLCVTSGRRSAELAAPRSAPALGRSRRSIVAASLAGLTVQKTWPRRTRDLREDEAERTSGRCTPMPMRSGCGCARMSHRAPNHRASVATFFFIDTDARLETVGPRCRSAERPSGRPNPRRLRSCSRRTRRRRGARRLGGSGAARGWRSPRAGRVSCRAGSRPGVLWRRRARARLRAGGCRAYIAGLDASCAGRSCPHAHLAAAPRAFGDDDLQRRPAARPRCLRRPDRRAQLSCRDDAQCPSGGPAARASVVQLRSTSAADADPVRADRQRCVLAVDWTCTSGRLRRPVCENGACVGCLDGGGRSCAAGLACSPNGSCVDRTTSYRRPASRHRKVRGGAFS